MNIHKKNVIYFIDVPQEISIMVVLYGLYAKTLNILLLLVNIQIIKMAMVDCIVLIGDILKKI